MGTMKQMPLAVACALAVMTVAPVEAQVQESVLHNFEKGTGYNSLAGVTLAPDGGIYGTTEFGGTADHGVVYKLDTAFHYTVLHNFTGADGATLVAGVIRDSAGNLYGAALSGGTGGSGVLYKLDSAGNYTVLYNFTGGTDGGGPKAGVVGDSAGNLYGTAGGGTGGGGVVYKLDSAANYTVLYNFTVGADGWYPSRGVIRDSAGNLYGTTIGGGGAPGEEYGVVYKLDSAGNYTVLYRFTKEDGTSPNGVILAPDGLYGTAEFGGTTNNGVVYKLDSAGNYTVLYNFTGGADGGWPLAGVIRDSAGNLYGTAYNGGTADYGVVYKLDYAGNYTVLHTFTGGADGGSPVGGVIRTPAGNLVGTTQRGGSGGDGVVFVLTGVQ
jgi:uncharacterized repeat protein (TIGR03803 family)